LRGRDYPIGEEVFRIDVVFDDRWLKFGSAIENRLGNVLGGSSSRGVIAERCGGIEEGAFNIDGCHSDGRRGPFRCEFDCRLGRALGERSCRNGRRRFDVCCLMRNRRCRSRSREQALQVIGSTYDEPVSQGSVRAAKCIWWQDESAGYLDEKGREINSGTHLRCFEYAVVLIKVDEVEGKDARNGGDGVQRGKPESRS